MPLIRHALRYLNRLRTDRRTVTSLEYGIIAAAIVIVGLASLSTVGTKVGTKMTSVKSALT